MNSSSNSLSCDYQHKGFGFLEQRQNFLSSDTSAAPISIRSNRQSPRVSINDISQHLSHTCCQDYTSAEKQIQAREVLLACLAGTGIMTGALGQPLFIAQS